jgi:hypothetical protein
MEKLLTHWRDHLKIHRAAELFPRMTDDELAELGNDIKKNGLASPIILWSPGFQGDGMGKRPRYVLDGINRLDAMQRMGIQIITSKGGLDELLFETRYEKKIDSGIKPATDPYAYVVSANINRRHLTAEQKRELAAKLLDINPNKSDRQIGDMIKADHKTIGRVRREKERRGDIPHVKARTDTKGRSQPSKVSKKAKPVPVKESTVECPDCDGTGIEQDTATLTIDKPCAPRRQRVSVNKVDIDNVEQAARLLAEHNAVLAEHNAVLENKNRVLETKILGLESENAELIKQNAELRARLPKVDDDDIPPLRRDH